MGWIIARGPEGGIWPIFDEGKIWGRAAPRLFVFPMSCISGGFDDRFLCACISVRTSFIWSIKEEQTSSLSTLRAVNRVKSPSPSFTRCAAFFNTRGKRKSRTCCEGSGSDSTNSPSSKSCSIVIVELEGLTNSPSSKLCAVVEGFGPLVGRSCFLTAKVF